MSSVPTTEPAYINNSAFSTTLPMHQLAWDSTSLGEFKLCPRRYYYSIVQGWTPRSESVHLTFGILLHTARERYDHVKVSGLDHEAALASVFEWAVRATWVKALGRPWLSDDPNKNRDTFLRTVVWYLDQFGKDDPLETIVLANGKPAVELSFQFPLGISPVIGEQMSYSGHMDRLVMFNGEPWVVDIKTTKNTIGPGYFVKYTPDNQFSGYLLAGRVAFAQPVRGLIVDAAQIAVTFSRFQRGPVTRTDAQIDEWADDLHTWLGLAAEMASRGADTVEPEAAWPQNDKSCDIYGGCQFRSICSKPRASRGQWLAAEFKRRQWNPLVARGDI